MPPSITCTFSLVKVMDGGMQVAASRDFSAALKADETLWTWGRNDNGQLGISTQLNQGSPSQVRKGESNAVGYYIQNVSSAAASSTCSFVRFVHACSTT